MNLQQVSVIDDKKAVANRPLTTNISTHTSYSKSGHRNNCKICKSPDLQKIDKAILTLDFKTLIKKYKLKPSTIINHIEKLNLFECIGVFQRAYLVKTLIKSDLSDPELADMTALLDKMSKMSGAYAQNDAPKNVQLIQSFVQNLHVEQKPLKPPTKLEKAPLFLQDVENKEEK